LSRSPDEPSTAQLGLFASPLDAAVPAGHHEISKRLKELDVDDITPRQALELLAELKKLAKD
jgi:hypothetical protein